MDPYERLAAINEEITRLKRPHRVQKKKQTRRAKEIFKAIDKAANTQEDPKEVEARLSAFYDKQDKSIFGESTEKIDQEFGAAKKALKDAGIKFKALQAIGSLDREKNTFNIPREDMRKARQVLKNFPNAQIKRA
tara:strand:- start:107 stop:511 length:405 start_codon:yes stop_codon:yes gene_type:complete